MRKRWRVTENKNPSLYDEMAHKYTVSEPRTAIVIIYA